MLYWWHLGWPTSIFYPAGNVWTLPADNFLPYIACFGPSSTETNRITFTFLALFFFLELFSVAFLILVSSATLTKLGMCRLIFSWQLLLSRSVSYLPSQFLVNQEQIFVFQVNFTSLLPTKRKDIVFNGLETKIINRTSHIFGETGGVFKSAKKS